MTESVLPHQQHAGLYYFLRAYGEGIRRHNLADSGFARVPPFNYNALHQVAFRKDAGQHAVAQHWHSANIAGHHRLRDFQNRLIDVAAMGMLILNQVADVHLPPPRPDIPSNPSEGVRQREYMTKRG